MRTILVRMIKVGSARWLWSKWLWTGIPIIMLALYPTLYTLLCVPRGTSPVLRPQVFIAVALANSKAKGANVHRKDAPCQTCHTADAVTLNRNASRAKLLLRPDLEAVCNRCHGDQGASHKTGGKPTMPVPATLPLSADGRLTCATCHFMHSENNSFGDFVRLDNRRGQLCLSCHKLSDLQ